MSARIRRCVAAVSFIIRSIGQPHSGPKRESELYKLIRRPKSFAASPNKDGYAPDHFLSRPGLVERDPGRADQLLDFATPNACFDGRPAVTDAEATEEARSQETHRLRLASLFGRACIPTMNFLAFSIRPRRCSGASRE